MKKHEDWKKAIVHLEGATDSVSWEEKQRLIDELRGAIKSKEDIDEHELFTMETEIMGKGSRDLRYQGTAIFLEHESRRYLVTARHVIEDKLSAERDNKIYGGNFERVFNIIFRVPSLDLVLSNQNVPKAILMNLNAGVSYMTPFTFSHPELDLAIISLDQRDSMFADELIADGYSPISLSDIADEPSVEGAEIYAIGFPQATAVLGNRELHPEQLNWASNTFSVPITSFGRVAMLHNHLPYVWGDLSIYPGNSGGPVIEDGKLVGIVSGQSTIYTEEMIDQQSGERVPFIARTRIPFAKVIKTKYIKELLAEQIEKDLKRNL
ncbi:serine protease [Priestia megaterium]|uniref:S1 family peptidase n=1 Tax=Priestia megaterium TaxID=1404 RepID=UPI00234EF4A5|nr:serine protease [Priestia megaterium]MDC7770349.1 serine protease [Priestia megaterium]